jgi:hypothetical protein
LANDAEEMNMKNKMYFKDPATIAILCNRQDGSAAEVLIDFADLEAVSKILGADAGIQARLPQNPAANNRFPGRPLLYVPSENVSDGASTYASNGFFDLYDCPPWDTWLQYSRGTLVSWVPEVLIPLAQIGIDANPVECIKWAD